MINFNELVADKLRKRIERDSIDARASYCQMDGRINVTFNNDECLMIIDANPAGALTLIPITFEFNISIEFMYKKIGILGVKPDENKFLFTHPLSEEDVANYIIYIIKEITTNV